VGKPESRVYYSGYWDAFETVGNTLASLDMPLYLDENQDFLPMQGVMLARPYSWLLAVQGAASMRGTISIGCDDCSA
jgi:hypothetical protein